MAKIKQPSLFLLIRQLKIRKLFDRLMSSIFELCSFARISECIKHLKLKPKEDGWRTAAQVYLRTEHTKFILAAFRLDLWSDFPAKENVSVGIAKKHLIKRLALFLLDYPITHRQLSWGKFSTKHEKKDPIDIVCAVFKADGTLDSIEPYLDQSHGSFRSISEDYMNLLDRTMVNKYNELNNFKDEYRPRRLKKDLLKWLKSHPPVPKNRSKDASRYLKRILNSTFIHFEILTANDTHNDVSRFKYPDFIKRKHPGFGILNICCRLTGDLKEADLWFQIAHVSIDGVPMQEILNSLKARWKTCGELILPSMSYKKNPIIPELCSTTSGPSGKYHAEKLVDFRPLLKIREELNQKYADKLSSPITVISMLGWGLGQHYIFSKRRFLFPVDLAKSDNRERTLGFVSIRPSKYIDNPGLVDSFLEYQLAFNRKLSRAHARINGIYKLFEIFALLPAPVYWFMQRFMIKLFSNVLGSIVITTIKDADFFVAPSSDVILEGFIAFGNFSIPTKDGKIAGIVSVKTTKDNVGLYLNAIEEIAGDFGKYL